MSFSYWSAALVLLTTLPAALSQEATAEKPAFDAAAEMAAFSALPEQTEFKRLWTSNKRVRLLHGLNISRDASRVIVLLPDGTPAVYDGNSGDELVRLAKPAAWVMCTALASDGSQGAVGLRNGEVVVFNAATGDIERRYLASKAGVRTLHFAVSGKHLTWLHGDGTFAQASLGEAEPHSAKIDLHNSSRRMYAFNPGGERVFVGFEGPTAALFTKPINKPQDPVIVGELQFEIAQTAVALADRYCAHYNEHGLFNIEAFRESPDVEPRSSSTFSNLTADVDWPRALAASTNGEWLLGVGRGQIEIRKIQCPVYPSIHNADFKVAAQVALSPDTLRVAIVDDDGYLSVLALPAVPELPAWRFTRVLTELFAEKRYADLDQLGEVIREDPESFPFEGAVPKYQTLIECLFRTWNPLGPKLKEHEALKEWLAERPDSTLARVKQAQNLIDEGWEARGGGYASTVTPDAFETFHLRLLDASNVLEPLLKEERPAPQAIFCMLTIAKAESHSLRECMKHIETLMKVSPRFSGPHVASVENLLPRWGGGPHSSAEYAGQVADTIGGAEGDALYAHLAITVIMYEGERAITPLTGLDFERAIRGAEHMQKSPQLRPLGTLYELRLADVNDDQARLASVIARIHKEKLPFVPGAMPVRYYYDHLYRTHFGRVQAKSG